MGREGVAELVARGRVAQLVARVGVAELVKGEYQRSWQGKGSRVSDKGGVAELVKRQG